ncbi:MAG: phosphoenolpyruvate--protein phosphotransferase [Planctomycetia bacterium]
METLRGIAVFPGVAIGPALVIDHRGQTVHRQHVPPGETAAEVARFDLSLVKLSARLEEHAAKIREKLGPEVAMIFEAHRRMITDAHLRRLVVALIEKQHWSAEHAVHDVLRQYADLLRGENSFLADRVVDVADVERQILGCLTGDQKRYDDGLDHEVVVLANNLTPSETAGFDPKLVRGLATETGGRTSHTAIVAGAMEIPAVVGLGRQLTELAAGRTVVVDGHRGVVIIDPDEPTLQKYRASALVMRRQEESLDQLRDLPAETLDGCRIELMGNIEFPHEAQHCIRRGADGVGLYRTEFLYLNRAEPPTEEEHYQAYAEVLKGLGGDKPVVFRTMDLGADKLHPTDGDRESNPFLGLRSIRLSLRNLTVFKTQLRALLRASVLGDVRIMFPLVSTVMEIRRCKLVLNDVMEDMEEEGIPFRRDVQVGMMVEVPSAALLAGDFAEHVDFFSIGTNDLIQYTLAVDRTNETVASLYNASDPAVIKLVRMVVRAAVKHGIHVHICGEMCGDPIYTMLLVGMGLRHLSVTPHNIPELKRLVRSMTLREAEKVVHRVLRLNTAAEITNSLRASTRRLAPELIDDLG